MQSIDNKLVSRIYGKQTGWAFSKNDFLDLGSDAAIRKALSRLEAKRTIRRVLRGSMIVDRKFNCSDFPQKNYFPKDL